MANSPLKASTALRRQTSTAHHLQANMAPRPHLKVMLLPQRRTNSHLQASMVRLQDLHQDSMAHHHPRDSTEHHRQDNMELLLHQASTGHPSQVVTAAPLRNRLSVTVSKQPTSI